MGILQKNPSFWASPYTPPLTPSFCPPQMKFDPHPKKVLDLPIRKKVQLVKKYGTFCSYFFGYSLLSKVTKYSESSPVMSSFQSIAYI